MLDLLYYLQECQEQYNNVYYQVLHLPSAENYNQAQHLQSWRGYLELTEHMRMIMRAKANMPAKLDGMTRVGT